MAKKAVIEDVARTRKEMVERLRHQEREARRAQEAAQQEHVLLTGILAWINEQSRQMDVLRERQESIPRISSSIVTPTLSAVGTKKNSKPPSLPIFSGEQPTPCGEAEYQQWVFQVRSFRESYTDEAIKNAVIANCHGRANTVVRAKGFDADLGDIIERLDKQFGVGQAGDEILREFHQMIQGPKESVQDFGAKLECIFGTINERFPGWYAPVQLKARFFHGINDRLRDSMRYLYEQPNTTFEDLLLTAMRVEGESRTSSTAKAKAVAAFEAGEGSSSPEPDLTDLTDHLVSLGQYLKSANFTGKPTGTGPKRDPRKQLQGPGPSAAGPFHNKPPVQCYKCNGWGHYQRQCPNRAKVTFSGERENENGEETKEGGSTPPRDAVNPPQ